MSLATFDIDPILAGVRLGLPLAKRIAALTATKADDELVSLLEQASVEGSPLLVLLRGILNDPLVVNAATAADVEAALAAHSGAIEAGKFDWKAILMLVLSLLGK